MDKRLSESANQLAEVLRSQPEAQKVVFAESCTCGMVAAALAAVPGISEYLCGSAVTYRESAKMAFLGVDLSLLEQFSDVSEPVTEQMAVNVLSRLPEASWSAAVTGHLGPNAPVDQDGVVFVAVASRRAEVELVECRRLQLADGKDRVERQKEATCFVLDALRESIR